MSSCGRGVLSRFRVRPGMLDLVQELRGRGLLVGILSEQHFHREPDSQA